MDSRETVLAKAKADWEAIAENDEDATLDWALEWGDTLLGLAALRQPTPDKAKVCEICFGAEKVYYDEQCEGIDCQACAHLAALEEPMPEMVEIVARVYNQTRWGVAINLSGETVYRPTAHDAMTAALKAVAAHLRKA